ncbi:MAG: ABC transporter substrate-binding protein [Eubacteriales bacterium]|nr:ABC transporter substrate-binding protein [Eubacteriales bacterium]
MLRKTITVLLCCCLLLGVAACAVQESKPAAAGNTVTDASGTVLAVPAEGEQVKMASVYAVSVPFIVALQLQDKVCAINCKSKFWSDNVEALGLAGNVGRGVVDLEALAASGATVLIHRSNDSKTAEAVQPLGIDVLTIRAESMEDVANTLRLMGAYFGAEARAEEVISWMDAKFAYIDSIVKDIPEVERPTALTMGGELGRIAGGDMLQSWMIEKAGGIPVSAEVTNNCNWSQVGVEQVFAFDPEYLFLTSSTPLDYSSEELLEDSAWSAMRAVQDGRVYQIPSKIDSWDLPGVVSVIGTMWMLHQMHPEHFSKEQLQQEVDEYYTFLFGKTFDAAYLGYAIEG